MTNSKNTKYYIHLDTGRNPGIILNKVTKEFVSYFNVYDSNNLDEEYLFVSKLKTLEFLRNNLYCWVNKEEPISICPTSVHLRIKK